MFARTRKRLNPSTGTQEPGWQGVQIQKSSRPACTPSSHGSFGDMKNIESLGFPTTGIHQTSTAMFTRNPMVQMLTRPVVTIHFELQDEI